MEGKYFLTIAQELARGSSEAHWRTSAGRAYYALFLEGRELLSRWGFVPVKGAGVHAFVRLRFTFAADVDLKKVGLNMGELVELRSKADYDLTSSLFLTDKRAWEAVNLAKAGLDFLTVIAADAARSVAIIADIKSRWP